MSRIARKGASLLAVAVALVFIPIGVSAAWFAMRAPANAAGPTTDLRVALLRAGLGAESLAAAGVSAQETTSVVGAFATAMAGDSGALEQADADYVEARVTRDALQRKVRSGLATAQEISALAAAKSAFTSAEARRAAVLEGWFEDATAGLSNAEIATLSMIHANADWSLPVELLVKNRDEAEWVALRDALSNERICAKYDDPPNQSMQSALATWRSDATVAAAKTASNANLASLESAWAAATGN